MYNKVSRRVRREVELCCVVWWRVSSEVFVGTVRGGMDERGCGRKRERATRGQGGARGGGERR